MTVCSFCKYDIGKKLIYRCEQCAEQTAIRTFGRLIGLTIWPAMFVVFGVAAIFTSEDIFGNESRKELIAGFIGALGITLYCVATIVVDHRRRKLNPYYN